MKLTFNKLNEDSKSIDSKENSSVTETYDVDEMPQEVIDRLNKYLNRVGIKIISYSPFFGFEMKSSRDDEYVYITQRHGQFVISTVSSYWTLKQAKEFRDKLNVYYGVLEDIANDPMTKEYVKLF